MFRSRRAFLASAAITGAAGSQLLTPRGSQAQVAAPAPAIPGSAPSDDHTVFVLSPAVDPVDLFERWLADAKQAGDANPAAMTLATVDRSGLPDGRVMLHQEVRNGDFLFTTYANSTKGRELRRNPKAALVFYWATTGRQVRVRGDVRQMNPVEARPYGTFGARRRR